jgi:hypothetical protein
MKNSNLINDVLSASGLSNLPIFFTLERKGIGRFLCVEEVKAAKDLETLFMAIIQIDLA